jgi:hypothetical protein
MKIVVFALIVFLLTLVSSAITAQQTATPIECGTILEAELTTNDLNDGDDPEHIYSINLNAGDTINVRVERIGSFLHFYLLLYGPQGNRLVEDTQGNGIAQIEGNVTATGLYTISIFGHDANNIGAYQAFFGCTLRDGTVIAPGDIPSSNPTSIPTFSGFGLPPLPAVDFSAGIEIPIALGQPQTAPIAANLVALYNYTASEGETRTLSLSRASGNISIGVTVIKKENNEIVFLGGMPSSNNLSVELTFPSAGDYVIGLFVLNTSTLTGSSGAVTVQLD